MTTTSLQKGRVGLTRLVSTLQYPNMSAFKSDSSKLCFAHNIAIHCSPRSVSHWLPSHGIHYWLPHVHWKYCSRFCGGFKKWLKSSPSNALTQWAFLTSLFLRLLTPCAEIFSSPSMDIYLALVCLSDLFLTIRPWYPKFMAEILCSLFYLPSQILSTLSYLPSKLLTFLQSQLIYFIQYDLIFQNKSEMSFHSLPCFLFHPSHHVLHAPGTHFKCYLQSTPWLPYAGVLFVLHGQLPISAHNWLIQCYFTCSSCSTI